MGLNREDGAKPSDLLTFSRTALADDDVAVETAELSVALDEAVSVFSGRIEETHANIIVGQQPRVRADATQIAPEIDISAKPEGGQWIIAVRDNGIGFDQRYVERIFGLFQRLYKDEYPGTGLGLAICQRIVERYGGRMWANSSLGQGSTFYFSLPCLET